jgi:predicted DCC family thiol-disulfide oxidoreductase YuxK
MDSRFPLTLYFDGACPLCQAEMRNLSARDVHARLRFVDVSVPGFVGCPSGTDVRALMTLMHATRPDGTLVCGVEVFRLAYEAVGMPGVAWFTGLPGIRQLCEALYPVIARNRYWLPAAPLRWIFERSLRRAAERASNRRCDERCELPSTHRRSES